MHEGGRDYRRERKSVEAKLLRQPLPGKRSLIEKVYGSAGPQPAAALDAEAMAAVEAVLTSSDHPAAPEARAHLERALGLAFAEGPAAAESGQRPFARGTTPPPAAAPGAVAEQPFLPAEVSRYVQATPAARPGSQWGQAAPAASAGARWGQAKQSAPRPEEGEVVAQRAPRRQPDDAPPSASAAPQPPVAAAAQAAEVPATRAERKKPAEKQPAARQPAHAAGQPFAAGPEATRQVLEDFDAGHDRPDEAGEDEDEIEIPEDLEGLDEERLDELASDLDLELPDGATVEQKRKAIEAARAVRQGKALKGVARRTKEVAADAAADQAGIAKKGKAQEAGRAAQGKAAAGATKAAAARRSFAKAKNVDELKGRLRKVMEEDKAKFDELLKKDSDELKKKLQAERDKASEELKALDQKTAAEIAAKEKEISGQIEKKRAEAKARAETDRKNAQTTTEAEKKRRQGEAAAEATRVEGEAAARAAKARADGPEGQAEAQRITAEAHQAAAAARARGDAAAQELDGKLAATLEKIGKAEVEGAAELEAEKTKLIADAQARAKAAHDEGKARVDAAIVKIGEQEKTGLEQLKAANEGLRKKAQEKFDAQMKKLESGSAEQLAELEAETNKIIGEIDQEVVKFQAMAQQQTQVVLEASRKAAQAAVTAIQAEGKKAIEQIDGLAKQAMERVDRKAAEMEARQAAVASEGQRRLTAATPEEAAAVEREAEAREKVEEDKVAAEKAAREAEDKKIDDAAADIADELDDTFVDEDAILDHLRGKSPEEIARIKAAYFKKTGKQLDAEVAGSSALDEKEMKEAKAHLSGDPVQRAVATLENAEDGWTGEEDEQRIKQTLAGLDPETRKKVAAEYEKQTGRRLNAMLEDELDESDAKASVVEEDPKKKIEVSQETKDSPAVHQAVSKLFGATADKYGTDEAAVYEALKGKTPEEIEAIKQVWLEKHGPPGLDAVLEEEMSGTELKEAKAMMSDDPVQKAVASLQNASDGLGTDKEKLQKTLESIKDPVLRAQVASEYEKQTGEKLDVMLVDELSGRDLDKAQAAAAGDVAALRAIKFDEAKNSSVIGDLAASASDLLAEAGIDIDPETIAIIADIAIVVVTGPLGLLYGAALLADEHIDLRDDENAMYQALEECKTPEERKAMEEAYNKRYAPKTLRGEIGELDGAEVDVATALLDGDKAGARAAKMKAGSEQLGWADKDLMFQALEECESKEERDALIAEYNRRYGAAAGGVDYQAMLDEQFKYNDLDREKAKQLTEDGKMDDAFALFYAQHAGLWGTTTNGLGTDEEAIAKILKGKSKEEIAELKKKYAALAGKYGREPDLEKSLDDETSGRTGKQMEMLMRGEPTTAAEALARQEEMAEFEREDTSGWAIDLVVLGLLGPLYAPYWLIARAAGLDTDEMAKGAIDSWNDSAENLEASQKRLRQKMAELESSMKKQPGESDADFEKRKLEAFKKEIEKEEGYLKNYQENKDATADAASTGVGLVVTAALSIATGGAGAWACALAGGLAGIGAKAAILGGAYELEDFGMDVVQVAAEAIAAGVAKGLDLDTAVEGLRALGAAENLIGKILKEALEEAIENGTSALILALFDENNYKSPEAFLFGVSRAVGQAALSGAVAAGVMVTLNDVIDGVLKERVKKAAWATLKGAVSEGIGGLAASAVDPSTWEGNMEAVLTRFGSGFIDNILSAGAEGLGESVGHAQRHARVDAHRQHLASQGIGNTAVVSGHILDLDSGRVFDGESGKELGRISVDPDTGLVTDVTDPANPVPIGVNQDLQGVRVGGVDTNAQAGASADANADATADAQADAQPDAGTAAPTQAEVDEAMAKAEAHDRAQVEQASLEKARAIVASMTGDARPGSSLEVATRIAAELALNGVSAELFGDDDHHFLKIGDTVIDGALLELFDAPDGAAAEIFIGSMDELRARLGELEATFGLRPDLAADTTVAQLFDSRFGGASASGMTLDIDAGAGTAQFSDSIDRGAGRIDADFSILASPGSVDPNVGFGELQQARARAALEGMSDADYIKMRTLMAAQGSDLARAYLLKALAAGNSMGEIERFASKIHGQSDVWLMANLSMSDPLQLGAGGGLAQQFTHSCNANMLIALMSDLDPVLALRMRENPDTAELLRRLEKQMLETPFQGNNPNGQAGEAGAAVPLEPGADFTSGRGRFIDDFLNAQAKWTGVSFSSELNPTAGRVIDVLDASLGLGVDVPVVVGPQPGSTAHYVLVTGRRVTDSGSVEYRFFDPATGRSTWISAADVTGGHLGLGVHQVVTGLEVPSAISVGGDVAVDVDEDSAADTERDPDAAPDTEPMTPGSAGGTPNVDAVLNDAGAMTARVRQMLGRMSPEGQAALERIASRALGDSPRVEGLVDWVQHTTKHTRKLDGDELSRRMNDAESELGAVERLLAEAPDTIIFMGGDRAAVTGAGGKKKSSDLMVVAPDGSQARVEVTRLSTPLAAVEQIDKPFIHGLKEDDLPPGTRREVSIQVALDPAAPATLLDELAAHLDTIGDNDKLDRMSLVDASGALVADFVRDESGWSRVAAADSGNLPGTAGAQLPLFDLRRRLPFLLTGSEKAFVATEAALDASGRRSSDPAVIVDHENVLLDLAPMSLEDGQLLMRQLADGNSHGLRARGIEVPFDFDSKQNEWGLAMLRGGGYGIIRGAATTVGPVGMPDVVSLVAHSHPLTAGREIAQPMHVEDILSGQMQYLLQPSGRAADVGVARAQDSHTIYMPYQYLGSGMIGQTVDNAPNQPFNGLDILRPAGIEVVMTKGPRIIGVHHVDADGNPLPVYLVSIEIRADGQLVYANDFGLFSNAQNGFERLTALDRMPTMAANAAAEHAGNMQALGLGDQVGPIDAMEVWTGAPSTPLGFAILDPAAAMSAFVRIVAGDVSGLVDIGMITDGLTSMPRDIAFALAQRGDGAFVVVRGDRAGVVVPADLVEIARGGGPAAASATPGLAPASFTSGGGGGGGGGSAPVAGSGWSGGGSSAGSGWEIG